MYRFLILVVLSISMQAQGALLFSNKDDFLNAITSNNTVVENWVGYAQDTVLGNQTVGGIKYKTNGLLVGASRTLGRLGFAGSTPGRYRSFGSIVLDMDIIGGASSFGISLSQGNQNSGVRREGTSIWEITFDSNEMFNVSVVTTTLDFTGEVFFGMKGINFTNVTIRRTFSDIGIVWNTRDIAFQKGVSQVNEPNLFALFGAFTFCFLFYRRLR